MSIVSEIADKSFNVESEPKYFDWPIVSNL